MRSHEFRGATLAKEHTRHEHKSTRHQNNRIGGSILAASLVAFPFGVAGHQILNHSSGEQNANISFGIQEPKLSTTTTIFEAEKQPKATHGATTTTRPRRIISASEIDPSTLTPTGQSWTGLASYYTRDECIGCHPDRIMANGQPLIDRALTVAFNRAPLGTRLEITNIENGLSVIAEVTDTGGFEDLGKIADLTNGTRQAISCDDICLVHIQKIA